LACLKQVPVGINIDSVTLVNVNGIHEEEHEYLKSRPDITRVLDYRKEGEYQWFGNVLDRFIYNDVISDYVLLMHPDCFPIRKNWGRILYERVIKSDIAGFPQIIVDGINLYSNACMINPNFITTNKLSFNYQYVCRTDETIRYKNYMLGVCHRDRMDYKLLDIGTIACGKAIEEGKDPFIMKPLYNYFVFGVIGHVIMNADIHPNFPNGFPHNLTDKARREFLRPLFDLYYRKKYRNLNLNTIVSQDDCPENLRSDLFTQLYEILPF